MTEEALSGLITDLKKSFGADFGTKQESVEDIEDFVALALYEARGQEPPAFLKKRAAQKAHLAIRSKERQADRSQKDLLRDVHQREKERAQARTVRDNPPEGDSTPSDKFDPAEIKALVRQVLNKVGRAVETPAPKRVGGGGGSAAAPQAGTPAPAKQQKSTGQAAGGGGGGGGHTRHNPFKRSPNLGLGPGTPPGHPEVVGKRHHDETKCWKCKCRNVYTGGCQCIGTGANKDCPKGHVKHVVIKKSYRDAYNRQYHAWRDKNPSAVTRQNAHTRTGY